MTLGKKKRDNRLAQLERNAEQYEAALVVERKARERAEEFATASLQAVEHAAVQWERLPERQGCATELRSLVARLRGLRDGRVL